MDMLVSSNLRALDRKVQVCSDRLRVALVTEPLSGGVGRHVCELAQALADRGHEIVLFHSPKRVEQELLSVVAGHARIRLVPVPLMRKISATDLVAPWVLAACIRKHGPFNIIHAHSSKAGAIARLALFFSKRVIFSPHAVVTLDPDLSRMKRVLYKAIEVGLARFTAGQVVACSRDEAKHLAEIGVPWEKINVVLNAVDVESRACERFARARLGIGPKQFCVGFVGRFVEQKRPEDFIAVVKVLRQRMGDLAAVMVGSGDKLPELNEAIARDGLGDVVRIVESSDARREIPMFNALCITSRYEGFPYVLIEALALGVPVVSTPIGGASQALRGDSCGSVVGEFDPEEFASRIIQLRQRSATEVSAACGERFEAEFQIERMVSELETVYFQVLQG